jgi:hypothetical protein
MAKTATKSKISKEQLEAAEAEINDRVRRIDFYMTEYSVELLAAKMDKGEFEIPVYQREFVWDTKRKSRFIESLIMGLPIPFLFFWERESGKLEIVDGSQRLRTIQEYLNGGLRLGNLTELPSLSKTRFTDLLESRQRKIENRSIRGIVLNEHADAQARFDLFERINTGSKVARPAEVRRGALHGPFQELVQELAKSEDLLRLAPVSESARKERIPEELVTRFFAYGDGLEDYKEDPADFAFKYTRAMNERFAVEANLREEYENRFNQMLKFVDRVFPNGFRKASNPNSTPRVRFEAIAVGTFLALQADPTLSHRPVDVSHWIEGNAFKRVTTTDAANVKSKLQRRLAFVRDALLGIE